MNVRASWPVHAEDGVGEHLRVPVGDLALDDGVLQVAHGVGDGDLLAPAQGRGEALLGRGELEELDQVPVLGRPGQRGPDAELDAADGIGLLADGGLLASAQVGLGVLRISRNRLSLESKYQ